MRKLIAIAAAAALFSLPAYAAPTWAPSQGGAVGPNVACAASDGSSIRCIQPSVTLNDATGAAIGTSGNPLITTPASGATSTVTGNVASGAADSGNPVKTGCVFNSTLPTISTGQRADCQADASGNQRARLAATLYQGTDGVANTGLGAVTGSSEASTGRPLATAGLVFNGTTWDRYLTCASSATVSVTAGSTTQIVGLSSTTVIRVCSITLSMSAAGSMGVYTGTGTNCGTGTTALIQDMALATGMPVAQTAPAGGSLVRSSAGGELCVKAVTGNVTGVITYAQF